MHPKGVLIQVNPVLSYDREFFARCQHFVPFGQFAHCIGYREEFQLKA